MKLLQNDILYNGNVGELHGAAEGDFYSPDSVMKANPNPNPARRAHISTLASMSPGGHKIETC